MGWCHCYQKCDRYVAINVEETKMKPFYGNKTNEINCLFVLFSFMDNCPTHNLLVMIEQTDGLTTQTLYRYAFTDESNAGYMCIEIDITSMKVPREQL